MDLSTLGHLPWTNLALANQAHIQSDLLAVLRHIQALRLEATCLFEFCGQAFKDGRDFSFCDMRDTDGIMASATR
jgi:hypothetical protein